MTIKCKRIIDGKTYNTETATRLEGYSRDIGRYEVGQYLYQTRFGAFFEFSFRDGGDEDDYEKITPLTPDDAQKWLEEHASWNPELIEKLFGEMPEAGSAEVKFTLRLPDSLRTKISTLAEANNQSLNAWIIRCLERCAAGGNDG